MKFYFELQGKRIIRHLREMGLNPYIGLVIGGCAFWLLSGLFFKKIPYPQFIYPIVAILSIYPLGNTKRNAFLKNSFTQRRYGQIRLLENLLLILPFCIFLLVHRQYLSAGSALAGAALCSLYNKADRTAFVIPSPFSGKPFECTTGFRKTWWLFILLYILTGIAVSVGNFNLGIFALLASLLVCMNFYADPEPVFYVWVHALSPRRFLRRKIKTAALYSGCLSLPITITLIAANPLKAQWVVLVQAIGILYVIMNTIGKYSNYPEPVEVVHLFKLILGVVFPPFLLILIPHFHTRSVKKLKEVLV